MTTPFGLLLSVTRLPLLRNRQVCHCRYLHCKTHSVLLFYEEQVDDFKKKNKKKKKQVIILHSKIILINHLISSKSLTCHRPWTVCPGHLHVPVQRRKYQVARLAFEHWAHVVCFSSGQTPSA